MEREELTLATLCDGAVNEKVNRALQKAFGNILDPNTDPKKKREVTLKLTLAPNVDDREDVAVEAIVSTKLAPEMGLKTQFYLDKDLESGDINAVEHTKGQIKGQLTFKDYGIYPQKKAEKTEKEELGCDPETGEIVEPEKPKVLDMRVARSM